MTSWRDAFVELGHEVATVDSDRHIDPRPSLYRKLVTRIVLHPGRKAMDRFNLDVLEAARSFRPQMTFFAPGRYMRPESISECREYGLTILHNNDDMFNRINQPPYFEEISRSVDCIFTTKSFNVAEFYAIGAARVEFLPDAYDPAVHFLQEPDAEDMKKLGCDVGFVGSFRPERADYLEKTIMCLEGAGVRVWGGNWEKMGRIHYRLPRFRWPLLAPVTGGPLVGANFRKVMQASRINLGLLNHRNRDLHTGRTFEIPACRGFMLAERTSEHQSMFEEDREAVFFETFEEMTDKIRYYLKHDAERSRIAEQGYRRCTESGYRFIDRAVSVLNVVAEMAGEGALPAGRRH
jgi:hypothetical protein